MRITARGRNGTIGLESPSLVWTSSSAGVADSSGGASGHPPSGSCPPDNTSCLGASPFFRVDGERLEAVGFSDAIRLSAGRSFDLAVASSTGVGEKGGETGVEEEEREPEGGTGKQGEEQEKGRRSRPLASGTTAALLRGDSGSLNASAGVVKVEVNRATAWAETRERKQRPTPREKEPSTHTHTWRVHEKGF